MKADSFRRENALTKLFGLRGKYVIYKVLRYFSVILFAITILLLNINFSYSWPTPITDDHINTIKNLFKKEGIKNGYVILDKYGRIELKGEYYDEKEVDKAFSIAQSVVGVKWVSPVTPENIKVKEWEKRLGSIFSRANVLKPPIKGDEPPGPIKNRYALVVGVGQFKYGINKLQYAVKDASSFYQFLTDPLRGNFPTKNVIFLTNEKATRDNIAKALNKIRNKAEEDDLVVIYISSHGTPPDKFGGVHIVTYDTEVKPRENVWHTALTDSMLRDFVENLRAKRMVMILDTCYSNGAYKNVPGFLPTGGKSLGVEDEEGYGISKEHGRRLLGAKDIVLEDELKKANTQSKGWGKVLISSSGSGEKSWESSILGSSIFTYYFIEGLNRYNGSIKEAFFYSKPLVYQKVKEEKGSDIEQKPQVIATSKNWDMDLTQGRP